eukprot:GHVS01013590.1.p1 GENE.GHVS01013590.1~~GHVS01013590.1.p1  ORF type:complete len:721 (+),score=107.39 GHVS01013590.1:268-2430(+)
MAPKREGHTKVEEEEEKPGLFEGVTCLWHVGKKRAEHEDCCALIQREMGVCQYRASVPSCPPPRGAGYYVIVDSRTEYEEICHINKRIAQADEMGIPVVLPSFFSDCVSKGRITAALLKKHRLHNKGKPTPPNTAAPPPTPPPSSSSSASAATQAYPPRSSRARTKQEGLLSDEVKKEEETIIGQRKRAKRQDENVKPLYEEQTSDTAVRTGSGPIVEEAAMVSRVTKGGVPVDPHFDEHKDYHVYVRDDQVWDVMLNQTNVCQNNNKYYIIQLLEHDSISSKFILWTRWGRVGYDGQYARKPFPNLEMAKCEFVDKFLAKTHNEWKNNPSNTLSDFESVPGQYTLLEMDYAQNEEEGAVSPGQVAEVESKLDPPVKELIELICDINMMSQQMKEIGYDARKLPLGKLSQRTIRSAFEVLQKLDKSLKAKNKNKSQDLHQLSSEFYTLIPHDFGFQKMRNFTISTKKLLKEKMQMVESLAEIEIATKLLKSGADRMTTCPADRHYQQLNVDIRPLDDSNQMHEAIVHYITSTHGITHVLWTMKIRHIFELCRHGEVEAFKPHADNKNRMLLWHGSRLTNLVGILSQGLRIAPPEAPVSGYMFGKGVYFADVASKSAQYCFPSSTAARGCLLLCEVALGDVNELLEADYEADRLPGQATKGIGRYYPEHMKEDPNGMKIPQGPCVSDEKDGQSLMYNEYIVYDTNRVRMRYLVEVEFEFQC